jgi:hypothetical protein
MYFLQVDITLPSSSSSSSGFGGFVVLAILLTIYLILCNQTAIAARKHGQNVTATFLVSLLLTPATGFLMVIANKGIRETVQITNREEVAEEV